MFSKIFTLIGTFFAVATATPALPAPLSTSTQVLKTAISSTAKLPVKIVEKPGDKITCQDRVVYQPQEKIVYRDGPEKIVYRDVQCNTSALTAQNNSLNESIAKGNVALQQAIDLINKKNSDIDYWKADSAKCNSLLNQTVSQEVQFSDAVTRYKALSDKWKEMYFTAIGQPIPN